MRLIKIIYTLFMLLSFSSYGQLIDSLAILNTAIERAVHSHTLDDLKRQIESRGHQPVLWNISKINLSESKKADTLFYDDGTYLIFEKLNRDFAEVFGENNDDILHLEYSIFLDHVKINAQEGDIELHFSTMFDSIRNWVCTFHSDNFGQPVLFDCHEKIDSLYLLRRGLSEYSGSWQGTYTRAEALTYIHKALKISFRHPYIEQRIIENIEEYDTARILNASAFELCDSSTVQPVFIGQYEIPFYTCKTDMTFRVRDLFINGGSYSLNEEAYNHYKGAMVIGRIELNSNGTLEIMLCEIGGLFMRRYHFIHYRGKYPTLISVQ